MVILLIVVEDSTFDQNILNRNRSLSVDDTHRRSRASRDWKTAIGDYNRKLK